MALKYNIDPSSTRLEKLEAAQGGTVADLKEMLNKHQIALMIRPTGFGKTHMMIELAKQEVYEKVLYLYPMDVIKQSIYESYHKNVIKFAESEQEHAANPRLPYIEFCTYSKMLEDYTHVYRFMGGDWDRLSKAEKEKIETKWTSLDTNAQQSYQAKWIKSRFEHIELLILDEAHMCGACGFLKYWDDIHSLTSKGLKSNRLHVLGATATQFRTASDIDLEKEIFYYNYGDKKVSARITPFTMEECWRFNILPRPYYVKGILNKEKEKADILEKLKKEADTNKDKEFSLSDAEDTIDELLSTIKPAHSIIQSTLMTTSGEQLENKDYMRFLIFYQNSAEMIQSHNEINSAIERAFIGKDVGYTHLNKYYITSTIQDILDADITISKVGVINERDIEISSSPDHGAYNIDIIHSIDMLNMGYHVGKVTGVIIKRATGSEIVYYQQIGRCISVTSSAQPIVIDFANAAAELQDRAITDDRAQALVAIKQFIGGCDKDETQTQAVNNLYKYTNMCFDTEELNEEFLRFWYLDRSAPIYYIHAISKAMGKKENPIVLISRLLEVCTKSRQKLVLDAEFLAGNARLGKEVQKFIGNETAYLGKASKLKR